MSIKVWLGLEQEHIYFTPGGYAGIKNGRLKMLHINLRATFVPIKRVYIMVTQRGKCG